MNQSVWSSLFHLRQEQYIASLRTGGYLLTLVYTRRCIAGSWQWNGGSHVRLLEWLESQVGPGDFHEHWRAGEFSWSTARQDTSAAREANSPN